MFKSVKFLAYLKEDSNTGRYLRSFKIIDDDFEECIEEYFEIDAVVNVYKNKNLNVAKNLWLYTNYLKTTNFFTIKQQIKWLMRYNEIYAKYADEIEKYLMLL